MILKNFGSDFGSQIYQQFTIGLTSDVDENSFTKEDHLHVYPNPSRGSIFIDVDLAQRSDGKVEIHDVMGKRVHSIEFKSSTSESVEVDLQKFGKGIYFVTLSAGNKKLTKRVVIL